MKAIDNLAPLIGCKIHEKKWSPYTGYKICKSLNIARLICLDLDSETYKKGLMTYKFNNKITLKTHNIHKLAREYSPEVLNTSYILGVVHDEVEPISIKELLFMHTHMNRNNDCAILDIFEENRQLQYNPYYRHVLFLLLDAFSLRWSLFEHFIEGADFPSVELRQERLDILAHNIRYVKTKLEETDPEGTSTLLHHLSNLLLNVLIVRYHVSNKMIVGVRK